ncbi:MAG: hypothetical protein EA355_05670 [Rhodobacteraceae bacterium]|nr:MAG: hypothetical protein EA355_05670 [Paracoccaceae bacterium]
MTQTRRPLSLSDLAHIVGRAAIALGIGWGYLAFVFALDLGGVASLAAESRHGAVVLMQVAALVGVAFLCTGAHIGYVNVRGEHAREAQRVVAMRRAEMRAWRRRR